MDVGRDNDDACSKKRREEKREEKSFYLLFNTSAYLWGVPWKTNEEEGKAGATADSSFAATGVKGKLRRQSVSAVVQRARCDRQQRQTRPTPPPPPPPGSRPAVFYYY